jgi:hypothetical protein
VNQVLGHICFTDVTTYYSSYEHTRNNPMKLPAIRKGTFKKCTYDNTLVLRRQSRKYYYAGEQYQMVDSKGKTVVTCTEWKVYRWNEVSNKTLQITPYKYILGILPKPLVPLDTTIDYIYECDTELLHLRKYIYPKPPIVPLPVHPFTVTLDYPALRRIFKGNENKRLGHFSLPRGTWTKRPKHMRIPIVDSIRIRNWIFAELMKNWATLVN